MKSLKSALLFLFGVALGALGLLFWKQYLSTDEQSWAMWNEPHLLVQTGLKLYDNVELYSKNVDDEYRGEENAEGKRLREQLKDNYRYQCRDYVDNQYISYVCNGITGYYYNFDIPERGLRINYHQDHFNHYEWDSHILPIPHFEDWYLSGGVFYGDKRFMLSFFSSWSKEDLKAPEIIDYGGTKFYPTGDQGPKGYFYTTIDKHRFGRLSFVTHPDKEYYYMLFHEGQECGPFCGIDHHGFQFFLP